MEVNTKIRNVAIIAHVDHGKTTLVDGFLKQSHTFRDNQAEMNQDLIMDSGDQERERGITITAKITAINYKDYRINIIDTPGHADFSGEVERTLNMADGCLLIVDAQEGPMPQTKFVLSKALANNLKVIVVINKIDKPARDIKKVKDALDDLFLELAVHEDQLHYPIYYAIGRQGQAWSDLPTDLNDSSADLDVLFQAIIKHVPAPRVDLNGPFQMQVTALNFDNFKGKYAIGRINKGKIKSGDSVVLLSSQSKDKNYKIENIFSSQGLTKIEVNQAEAGDIVQLTGVSEARIGDTICNPSSLEKLPDIEVELPTLQIYLGPNTSPFKGQESKFNTSRQIGDRLKKELETNVALRLEEDGIGFRVSGRGELHLGVLIESLRREGYEFEVGRPQVVTKFENNIELEPIEELIIEVPNEYSGSVQMELGKRRAQLVDQFSLSDSVIKLVYNLPTRNLLGLRNVLMTTSKGTVIMNSLVIKYEPCGPKLQQLRNGVLIGFENGKTTAYSLATAELRGIIFVGPNEDIYAGQIIGLNNRSEDMEINICKAKHLTNMRSSSSDTAPVLTPPTRMSLEQSLDFIENDELLEITPKSIRLRKKELNPTIRKRMKVQAN